MVVGFVMVMFRLAVVEIVFRLTMSAIAIRLAMVIIVFRPAVSMTVMPPAPTTIPILKFLLAVSAPIFKHRVTAAFADGTGKRQ